VSIPNKGSASGFTSLEKRGTKLGGEDGRLHGDWGSAGGRGLRSEKGGGSQQGAAVVANNKKHPTKRKNQKKNTTKKPKPGTMRDGRGTIRLVYGVGVL